MKEAQLFRSSRSVRASPAPALALTPVQMASESKDLKVGIVGWSGAVPEHEMSAIAFMRTAHVLVTASHSGHACIWTSDPVKPLYVCIRY